MKKGRYVCFCPNTGVIRAWINTIDYNYSSLEEKELLEITDTMIINFLNKDISSLSEKKIKELIDIGWKKIQDVKWNIRDSKLVKIED